MPWTEHCVALKFPHHANFKYSVKWSNRRIDQNKTNRKANIITERNIYAPLPLPHEHGHHCPLSSFLSETPPVAPM